MATLGNGVQPQTALTSQEPANEIVVNAFHMSQKIFTVHFEGVQLSSDPVPRTKLRIFEVSGRKQDGRPSC